MLSVSEFLVGYYLGLIVFVGSFVTLWRNARTLAEIKAAEKRIVRLILARRRRKK